ncbi:MAG: hypothetical protein J0L82_07230 [Deltaproteobacteria bacterium]|nr:hypothetical protein [Deltaproteobacteria bacterium]
MIQRLKASAPVLKIYRNRSGLKVHDNSVAPFATMLSIPMTSFISNNTHYTIREIISVDEVRFSIRSTLTDSGVPMDELIPRFTATRENTAQNISAKNAEELFPLTNPDGLRYRLENNRLVFYFPNEKSVVNVAIQFLPGNAPGNRAALESLAKEIQVVTEAQ